MEFVKSDDGKVKVPRILRLIKPIKQANPLSGEGLDLDESHELQGELHAYASKSVNIQFTTEGSNCALQKHLVVAERLFDMQAYKILDDAGPTGMTGAVSL